MGWRRLLLTGACIGATLGLVAVPQMASACVRVDAIVGACAAGEVDSESERVDIIGQIVDGADDSAEETDLVERAGESGSEEQADSPPPPMNCSPMNPAICAVPESDEPPPLDPAQPEPTLTLRDVASFSPGPSGLVSEPSGWAIVGRPVNLIAEAGTVTRAGVLLGRPVEVAFTPVSFEWTASSGERVVAGSAGRSWNELGLPALSSTDTSLRFEQPGRATVRLSVHYSAEYRFAGSGWRGIPGTLSVDAGELELLVGTFRTVLTDGDCRANPDGPGC